MTQAELGALRDQWNALWRELERALEDPVDWTGEMWDAWGLAMSIDVPAFGLSELIPVIRARGVVAGFDLVERLKQGVAAALERLREAGTEDSEGPLPLQFGMTGALLAWEWAEMEAAGERAWTFFERLRGLRERLPEVSLCERTVHRFCRQVPPPWSED